MFRRGLRHRIARTLVVHTIDGKSFRGVLVGDYSDCVVLKAPTYLSGENETAIGGELIVLRESISFMQDVTNVEKIARTLPAPAGIR